MISSEAPQAASTAGSVPAHPLAHTVLDGTPQAPQAAMELLELFQPRTICAAVGLLGAEGAPAVDAFDCIADAWATYRHVMHLSWD